MGPHRGLGQQTDGGGGSRKGAQMAESVIIRGCRMVGVGRGGGPPVRCSPTQVRLGRRARLPGHQEPVYFFLDLSVSFIPSDSASHAAPPPPRRPW